MGSKNIPVLFVTANVGSIFEDPSEMLKIWTEEFLSTVAKLDPKFIALHCQEVGGKNYEKSMKYVEDFVKLLMTSEELRLFDRVRVFIDEDYSSAEHFTALGNIYFVHESVQDVFIWDFKELEFVQVLGNEINTGNIEAIVTKEKAKFPQDFFPECKWSRKGFLRTRWSVSGTVFDLINIHLFHDASNFIAMEPFPSVYCKNRRRALEHTLQRFHNDRHGSAPFFVFGDFNFRSDTDGVIQKLTDGLIPTKVAHHKSNEFTKIQFHNDDNQLMLTIGKKEFKHSDHQDVFLSSDGSWLKSFDRELEAFENQLYEYPVTFPPSYPFEEKIKFATSYMQTRCPAWCDRVLLSHTAKTLIEDAEGIKYNLMGRETCMGDHKPVYLHVTLRSNSGTISCCEHSSNACNIILSTPGHADAVVCKCCQNYASIEINIIDMCEYVSGRNSYIDVDCTLLHELFTKDKLTHDPYTPESAESHSPLPEDAMSLQTLPSAHLDSARKQSVSPRILKSRLENILRSDPDVQKQQPIITETHEIRHCRYLGQNKPVHLEVNCQNYKENLDLRCPYIDQSQSVRVQPFHLENDELNHYQYLDNQSLHLEVISPSVIEVNDELCNSRHALHSFEVNNEPTCIDKCNLKHQRHLDKSQSQHLDFKASLHSRARCMSESARKISKIRLISTQSAHSIHRLQSHHSSSDEDWFEFDDITKTDIGPHDDDDVFCESNLTSTDIVELTEDTNRNLELSKNTKRRACCCLL